MRSVATLAQVRQWAEGGSGARPCLHVGFEATQPGAGVVGLNGDVTMAINRNVPVELQKNKRKDGCDDKDSTATSTTAALVSSEPVLVLFTAPRLPPTQSEKLVVVCSSQ